MEGVLRQEIRYFLGIPLGVRPFICSKQVRGRALRRSRLRARVAQKKRAYPYENAQKRAGLPGGKKILLKIPFRKLSEILTKIQKNSL